MSVRLLGINELMVNFAIYSLPKSKDQSCTNHATYCGIHIDFFH